MTISKDIWRFQCDPNGEEDPTVQVYLRKRTTVDGEDFVKDDITPVQIKLSELTKVSDLTDVSKIEAKQDELAQAAEAVVAEPINP